MSSGLIALLDDVATIAKMAAASLDDVAAQSAKAGAKAAGIVIDDAAVTPRYVVGFAASRELPIIRQIAWGSLRNKIVVLLPVALLLSLFAPWAIPPLLMVGGLFLCFEGYEKVHDLVTGHTDEGAKALVDASPEEARAFEAQRVQSAIKTDLILSAEIMAITLSVVAALSFWQQATILAVVAVAITAIVYGAVAVLVKLDDIGLWLASEGAPAVRPIGRGLVAAMPRVFTLLSVVGTAAMLWVGGGILVHGLELIGYPAPAKALHGVAAAVGGAMPVAQGFITWLVDATLAAIVGVVAGFASAPLFGLAARFGKG
jgi:hypothetical protein